MTSVGPSSAALRGERGEMAEPVKPSAEEQREVLRRPPSFLGYGVPYGDYHCTTLSYPFGPAFTLYQLITIACVTRRNAVSECDVSNVSATKKQRQLKIPC